MNLAFLTPLFLAGLAALAIPVLIHLVHRPNPQGAPFPSLMFLRQIPYRERRRLRIQNWWLLALRCLALALLALAFARPFSVNPAAAGVGLTGQRDIVILLDRSYSMGYSDHAERARQQASAVIDGLAGGDRAALLLFDTATTAATELTSDPAALRAALADYQPSAGTTDFAGALEQAARLLRPGAPRRELVLISDLQRTGLAPETTLRLPADITLDLRPVNDTAVNNAAVTAVNIKPAPAEHGKLELTAQVRNTGDQPSDSLNVILTIDGREHATQTVTLAAHTSASVAFTLPPPRDRPSQVVVRLGADSLLADNGFYLALVPTRALPVLVLEPQRPRPYQSLYLTRALELSAQPGFQVTRQAIGEFAASDLAAWSLIAFNDTPLPGGATGVTLREYVANGGGILLSAADGVQGGWPGGPTGYAPGALARRVDREAGVALVQFDRSHPLFEPAGESQTDPLADTAVPGTVVRYRELTPSPEDAVLARYQDGAVALVERRLGAGRVVALTTTLDTPWNDLALQPGFPLFAQRLARYLAGFEDTPVWARVSAIVDLPHHARALGTPLPAGSALEVKTPTGAQLHLAGTAPLLTLNEPGFYQIRTAADSRNEVLLAANLDTAESDLGAFTPEDFRALVNVTPAPVTAAATAAAAQIPTHQEHRQRWWWYLLLTALALLALESLYAHWLTRRPAGVRPA